MIPNQVAAVVLSVLAVGAGAVGAAQVTGPLQSNAPPWANDDHERNVDIAVDGNVTAGETVTLAATLDGEPVPHAPVEVNGDTVGETDADGQLAVRVPDADEFEVEIEPEYEGEMTVPLAEDDDEMEDEDAEADDEGDERSIDLSVDGDVTPNETVTVTATVNGTPLAGATVSVNGDEVGATDDNGTVAVTVPEDADEFEVEAEYEPKGKLTVDLADEDEGDEHEDDEMEDEGDEHEDDEREADDEEDDELQVAVDGTVAAGETVTVTATHDDEPVEGAAVEVNGEAVGTTDADGQLAVELPADADEYEIEVETDDLEGEWELELEDDEDGDDD